MTVSTPPYPVTFEVVYPEDIGRAKILYRWILAIPQLILADVLSNLASALAFFAGFVILFKKRYPEDMFRLVVGATRWQNNVTAYVLFQDGPYPPFSFNDGDCPYMVYDVERQTEYNRWLPLVKWILLLPHYIVFAFLSFAAMIVWLCAFAAVVVTGRFPRGMFEFLVGVGRWGARMGAYLLLQTDRYPPFSLR